MNRIAYSERLCQALREKLFDGKDTAEHPLDSFIRLGARYMLQVALEQEVQEFLGRAHYKRGHRRNFGYRNGYKPRNLKSANGLLHVALPQVRDTDEDYRSKLVKKLKNGSDVLHKLVTEIYARGLSTADIKEMFLDIFGNMDSVATEVQQPAIASAVCLKQIFRSCFMHILYRFQKSFYRQFCT
jgi:transposase-like protein